jgi:hypothetical protein
MELNQNHGRVRWLDTIKNVEGGKKSGHSDVMSRIHEQFPIGRGQFRLGVIVKMFNQLLHQRACWVIAHHKFVALQNEMTWTNDVTTHLFTSTKTLHFQIVSFHLKTKVRKIFHRNGKVFFCPFRQRHIETILEKPKIH